jgi:long-subunit acyl-CoA synthetase (AMP-forming)
VARNLGPIVEALEMTARDRILLFLPMSNFQQRFACYAALRSGSDIILTNFRLVFDALVKLEPTIFLAPPIFYQMVHDEFKRKWRRQPRVALAWLALLAPSPLRACASRCCRGSCRNSTGSSARGCEP